MKIDQDGNQVSSMSLDTSELPSSGNSNTAQVSRNSQWNQAVNSDQGSVAEATRPEKSQELSHDFKMDVVAEPGTGNTEQVSSVAVDPSDASSDTSMSGLYGGSPPKSSPKLWTEDMELLAKRDREAVLFSRNLLTEGDTLVYILYPGKAYDSSGICVSDCVHRVHSQKLLATGSEKFEELFSPTKQFRTLRKKHINLANKLPSGIKYVLDLTPPDEGDEAVDLTANLSCSYGICQWYSAFERLKVSESLVSGKDEFIESSRHLRNGSFGDNAHEERTIQDVEMERPATSIDKGGSIDQGFSPRLYIPPPRTGAEADRDLEQALLASRSVIPILPRKRQKWKYQDIPEYDPVRHRVGIVRLLQVLDGKDPRIDSAVKLWTLFRLAQYFDCTSKVVDWIIRWMIADPNSKFIEVLPEASCKIGFGLQNAEIARASFAILVGEEALSLVSRSQGKYLADQKKTNQFGRRTESIDEDVKTRIEYASKAFVDRINRRFNNLLEVKCAYFDGCAQYQKLDSFRQAIETVAKQNNPTWIQAVDDLKIALRHWVRGRIIRTLTDDLTADLSSSSDRSRVVEDYGPISDPKNMSDIYAGLSLDERIMTSFFWSMLQNMQIDDIESGYHIKSNLRFDNDSEVIARAHGIESLSFDALLKARDEFNVAVLEATMAGKYSNGELDYDWSDHRRTSAPKLDQSAASTTGVYRYRDRYSGNQLQNQDELMEFPPDVGFGVSTASRQFQFTSGYGNPSTALPYRSAEKSSATSSTGAATNDTRDSNATEGSTTSRKRQKVLLDLNKHFNEDSSEGYQNEDEFAGTPQGLEDDLRPASNYGSASKKVINPLEAIRNFLKPGTFASNQSTSHTLPGDESFTSRADPWQRDFETIQTPRHAIGNIFLPKTIPQVPFESDTGPNSIFFHLEYFLREVQVHVDGVCSSVLSKSELGIDIDLTDTLVSLAPMEYKYLPLWANGDDDGSGGVFNEDLPTAVGGPSGPGPAFHTGLSVSSQNSSRSESSFATASHMGSKGTSEMAIDGYSDALPRNAVVSDDGFHSEGFSDVDSDIWDAIGKGKNPVYAASAAGTATDSTVDNDTASYDGGSEAGTEVGYDFVSDTDSNAGISKTQAAEPEAEEEEDDFLDVEDEAFDFGDDDDDDEDMKFTTTS